MTIGNRPGARAPGSTQDDADGSPRSVLVAQALDALRFRGWFFCVSDLSAPWALRLPGGRFAAMHVVLEGACVVGCAGETGMLRLDRGDVVVLPRDDIHFVADRPGRRPIPISAIAGIDRRDRNATTFAYGGGGARTRLLTASFVADTRGAAGLVAGLPAAIALRTETGACARIDPMLALLRAEAAQPDGISAAVLRRAAEILFIQALREALLSARPTTGWLAAAGDPRLAAALTAMHAEPERRWTLAGLARLAHLSRTAFFERFQSCLGQTPAAYLQDWRLQLAARRLRATPDSVGVVAAAAGYDSPSAFARAFRRVHGLSPKAFRGAGERT
jgi:AraC-like DNA-binding protein